MDNGSTFNRKIPNPWPRPYVEEIWEAVSTYLDAGLSVIPLHKNSKIPNVPKDNPLWDHHIDEVGRIEETPSGYLRLLYDPDNPLNKPCFENPANYGEEEMETDGRVWTKKNYFDSDKHGIFYGVAISLKPSGLSALDIDGEEPRKALEERGIIIPEGSVTVISGREDGGSHHYFKAPEGIEWSTASNAIDLWGIEGLEFKIRGYMVAPPTRHPDTGVRYRFEGMGFTND